MILASVHPLKCCKPETSYVLLFAALQPRKTYSQLIVTFHAENDYTSASSISVLSFCYLCPLC